MMDDWYEYKIEKPVREIVRLLRNQGINTEQSCGHRLYIQCQFLDKCEELDMIYNVMCQLGIKNYKILLVDEIREGFRNTWLDICLPDEKGLYSYELKWNDNFKEQSIT